MAEHEQPIIIKKKKKGGHGGHHGGAWKVAYADFVTAMMAFFLVMWILGLSPDSKQKIASFFRDPGVFSFTTGKQIPLDLQLVAGSKGNQGNGNGNAGMMPSDIEQDQNTEHNPQVDSLLKQLKQEAIKDSIESAIRIDEISQKLQADLQEMAKQDAQLQQLLDNVQVTVSPDGLRIELMETKETVFFEVGSTILTKSAIKILKQVGMEVGKLENHVSLEGHTDSRGYPNAKTGYSNWELSAERANAARRILENSGLWTGQIMNVTGYADRRLRNTANPFDPSNRRVTIVISQLNPDEIVENKLKQHNIKVEAPPRTEHLPKHESTTSH
ncbi:MAG: OmpA family protein [Candidatus Kapabacteria bacterium]|nr:OmpA family protein [Candidatus Kapabacteria bacterium]